MGPGRDAATVFRCPRCRGALEVSETDDTLHCNACEFVPDVADGVIDFVVARDGSERVYYDDYYRESTLAPPPEDLSTLAATWTEPDAPWEMRRVWDRLGDIEGETVLLLGNGESFNELHLLTQAPRALVYSDLSPVGLRELGNAIGAGPRDNLFLAAIDAYELPFPDSSVDVVYGFAFVHHMPALEPFFAELMRVLRPGGRCVFMDNAYSPVWQRLKLGVLRPLMRLSHRREPRSPEDVRETEAGGFREEALAEEISKAGGTPWFERIGFFYYFWKRASVSLFPELFRWLPAAKVTRAAIAVDRRLERYAWAQRNMIRLVWGLDKPR